MDKTKFVGGYLKPNPVWVRDWTYQPGVRYCNALFAREMALASVVAWVQQDMETGGRLAKWMTAPTFEDQRRIGRTEPRF